jgi:hypothetical protein
MSSHSGAPKEWVAALPFSSGTSLAGRLSKLGGTLSLIDDEVVFTPLWGLGRTRRIPLREIDGVTASGDRPPRLRIRLTRGKPVVLLVLPKRSASIRSDDASARDNAVATIEAARLAP